VPPKWLADGAPLRRLTAAFCDNYNKKHASNRLDDATMRLSGRDGACLPFGARVTRDLDEHLYVVPAPAREPPKTSARGGRAAGADDVGIPQRLYKPPAVRKAKSKALEHDASNCYDLDDAGDDDGDDCDDGGGPGDDARTLAAGTRLKDEGNAELAAKRYASAVRKYDEALALQPPPLERLAAVLLANRAQALLSRVADGSNLSSAAVFAALRDAESNAREACEADVKYDKAFYRLGLANVEFTKRCAGGGDGAPLPDEVEARLKEAVKALARAARISPKSKQMRDTHKEASELLAEHVAALDGSTLPPCYEGRPPVVKAANDAGDPFDPEWIDLRAATTIPVERKRSGVVEATIELPLLLKKQWNRNNRGELAVAIAVSDHLGSDAIQQAASNLGPAWTVGEGLFAGKRWGGGHLSIPDRTGVLKGAPQDHFLLHPSALDDGQVRRLADLGLVTLDVREPVTVRRDDQHEPITLRVCACAF